MQSKNKGYVYVASVVGNPNACKIGFTRGKPEDRVSKLSNDYPGLSFTLYNSFELDRPKRNENMAHEILSNKRIDRELFSVTPIEGCIAVHRTMGKHFYQIQSNSFSGDYKRFYDYVRFNLELEWFPELSFDQFKCLINTYLEVHNVRLPRDIDAEKLILLSEECGL